MKWRTIGAVLVSLCVFVSPIHAQEELIFATTTSVQDTGLLDVIVPIFEKQHGYHVKAVAVGTGQALALAAKGEADVVLAHAPDTEKKYVADGVLVNRRLMMHNWFLLAGPAADPAKSKAPQKLLMHSRRLLRPRLHCSRATIPARTSERRSCGKRLASSPQGRYIEAGQGMGKTLGIAGESKPM
jgi:tungstate transport system substrate-binding protein